MSATLVTRENVEEIIEQVKTCLPGARIAVDCETTGLHPYQGDTLRGFSFAFGNRIGVLEGEQSPIVSYYVPVAYGSLDDLPERQLRELCRAIKQVDPVYVYHHAKFDLRFLRQLPRDVDGSIFFPVPEPGKLWDTKVVAWLMDENIGTSLQAQAEFHLGEGKSDYMKQLVKERGGWDKLTAQDTAEYGSKDAELTLRLCHRQHEILYSYLDHPTLHGHPGKAVEREMAIQGLLLRVEANGILVDSGRLKELLETAEAECQLIEDSFTEAYATNINSTVQLTTLLYTTLEFPVPSKTPGGKPCVNRAALEKLPDSSVRDDLLKHRRLRKAISGYLRPLLEHVGMDDRIHPTFWSMGTVTGRFSCSDPNLQTIPRSDTLVGVRDVFVAGPGMELWEYDLSAAEMRVVAGMAKEQVLIDGLDSGADMHALLAERVFGPDFTSLQRRQAKNIGYGFFYGLTSPVTAAKYIDGADAKQVAVKILDGLKEMYPNVVKLMRQESRRAEKEGFVRVHPTAWPGRFRRFVTESPKKPFAYTSLNAQVQGGIGELMKDVMIAVEPVLDEMGARICLQVHDSLVIELPEGWGGNVHLVLQDALDLLSPFDMRMLFDAKRWEDHE